MFHHIYNRLIERLNETEKKKSIMKWKLLKLIKRYPIH